ncbi:hypothetical protein HK096_000571, partial [Nowakowskiella sp. JEL0078]
MAIADHSSAVKNLENVCSSYRDVFSRSHLDIFSGSISGFGGGIYNEQLTTVESSNKIDVQISATWKFWTSVFGHLIKISGFDVNDGVSIPKDFDLKSSLPNETGFTMLHYASSGLIPELVSFLCGNWFEGWHINSNVNILSLMPSKTPLQFAVSKIPAVRPETRNLKIQFIGENSEENRQLETVKKLLSADANPLIEGEDGETALFKFMSILPNAPTSGIPLPHQMKVLELLIESSRKHEGIDLHPKKEFRTPLILALEKGYDDIAKTLVDIGANVNFIGEHGNSTAIYAIQTGRVSALQTVKNADFNVANDKGTTPLILACKISRMASSLLNICPALNINASDKTGHTALTITCYRNLNSEIDLLLRRGANVYHKGPNDFTPLIWAIKQNNILTVKALIEAAPDKSKLLDVHDTNGIWALHHAIEVNYKIVHLLLESGADPNVQRKSDNATPLHLSIQLTKCAINKSLKIERDLVVHGAELNAIDCQGRTPLHIAFVELNRIPQMSITTKEKKIVEKYLEKKNKEDGRKSKLVAEVNSLFDKNTPKELKEYLIDHRLNADLKAYDTIIDNRNCSSEYVNGTWNFNDKLVNFDPVEIVDYLIELDGLSCDIADNFGRSPLHYAAEIGATSSTNAILSKGATIGRRDFDGNTPINLALSNNNVDLVLNLSLRGAEVNDEIVLPNGNKETSFKFSLSRDFMSVAYIIKRQGQNILQAIDDSLRTGKYSVALAIAMGARKEEFVRFDESGRNIFHIMADFSPLHQESWNEDYLPDLFHYMLDLGIELDVVDNQNRTPLICATINSQFTMVKLILKTSVALIDKHDIFGHTALSRALKAKSLPMINAILEVGGLVDCGDILKRPSDARLAVDTKNKNILSAILSANAKLDLDNENTNQMMSALMKAVQINEISMVKKLLYAGANPNLKSYLSHKDNDFVYTTPIFIASLECMKILLEFHADPNVLHPVSAQSPLMLALEEENIEKLRCLLLKQANVNVIDPKYKRTPFQIVLHEKSRLINEFIKFNPNLDISDEITGLFPIDFAIIENDFNLLKLLFKRNPNPNCISVPRVNPLGMTPLMRAINLNEINFVNLLLNENTLDIQAVDARGRTALHYAVQPEEVASFENKSIIKKLLDSGFNINAKDAEGKMPSDYAKKQKSGVLLEYLLEFGAEAPGEIEEFDVEMDVENEVPDFKHDAVLEKERIIEELKVKDKLRLLKLAESRGISVENLERESKKQSWVKPCHLANVDANQVQVLFEGDGFKEYVPYDVMLHKCDVSKGIYGENKFYQMQILYNHLQDIHFLFNRWGGLGSIYDGMYQKTPFASKEECVDEFKKIFKSKSGNEWDATGEFVPKPGKYALSK